MTNDVATLSTRLHFISNVQNLKLDSSTKLFTIDGNLCSTVEELFTEFAKILQFPKYFGYNWSAFEDCLFDMEWIKKLYGKDTAYIYISNFEKVLADFPQDKAILCRILNTDYIVDKTNPEHLMQYPIDIQFFILESEHKYYIENHSVIAWNGNE